MQKFTNCLWFDGNAEDAAKFYVSVFPNSKILTVTHYPKAGSEKHGRPPGSAMTVTFSLDGQEFVGLNAGPQFKFNEAVSIMINCRTQKEVDELWEKLLAGGGEERGCGWVKDKFGLFWQVVPVGLMEMHAKGDERQRGQVMQAMMKMNKLDIAKLKAAFEQ